jgi:1-phosphofructokinase family hexose kinase
MVLTLTPSPVLDLSGEVESLVPNEKNYVENVRRTPGGNAINAARILQRLGVDVSATGFIGGGVGGEIEELLAAEKVKTNFIEIKTSSRINVTVGNRRSHEQTRLSFPSPRISPREKNALLKLVGTPNRWEMLVIGGSLPPGFPAAEIRKISRWALAKGIPCVVDCPAEAMREVIKDKPFLIKPNLTELNGLLRSKARTIEDVKKLAAKFLSHIPYVCVSSVDGGAVLIGTDRCAFGRVPPLKVRSTVGAGDSMVAAMCSRIQLGERDPHELLRWGLAGSAATLSHPGVQLGSAAQIRKFLGQIEISNA